MTDRSTDIIAYPAKPHAEGTDADRADYLAADIVRQGFESATCVHDPWEPDIYVRALKCFAAAIRRGDAV